MVENAENRLKKIAEDFGRHAREYDGYAQLQHALLKESLNRILAEVTSDTKLLDVGCGTGAFFSLLRKAGAACEMYGADIALPMLQRAQRYGGQMLCADAHTLPYADESFDVVHSSAVLQWSHDLSAAFSELSRILKQGARAHITLFGSQSLQELRSCFDSLNIPCPLVPLPQVAEVESALKYSEMIAEIVVEHRIQHYASFIEMLRSMSRIGAGNKSDITLSPTQLRAVQKTYSTSCSDKEGIFASWEVISVTFRK